VAGRATLARVTPRDALCWPAPERNKAAILEVLRRILPRRGRVLELASGSGQHVVYFARHLPELAFLPSDIDPRHLDSIRAWIAQTPLENVEAPRQLDVCAADYGIGEVDAIFGANLLHISPWSCSEGLFDGARRHLAAGGVLALYGPFHVGGRPTAESNATFDADLRRRDPSWGVRDVDAVTALASRAGLVLRERIDMPANNQILVYEKPGP
jgi:SAM-dependent methyltransferase